MAAVRHTISPSKIDLLREHLRSYKGETVVFLRVMPDGSPFADYVIEIRGHGGSTFEHTLGGHGIGSNRRHPVNLDATSERILAAC